VPDISNIPLDKRDETLWALQKNKKTTTFDYAKETIRRLLPLRIWGCVWREITTTPHTQTSIWIV